MMIEMVPSSGAGIVLKLIGRLNFAARQKFQEAIKDARAANAKSITLNLEQVSYIDSAGLGLLMLTYKELSEAGISFNSLYVSIRSPRAALISFLIKLLNSRT